MATKSFTLDGKRYRLPPNIPTADIRYMIGNRHVAEPDAEIRELMAARTRTWSAELQNIATLYALRCHRANQHLFATFRF